MADNNELHSILRAATKVPGYKVDCWQAVLRIERALNFVDRPVQVLAGRQT